MLNRCRMYLQLISLYDLLIYNTTEIHPAYLTGHIPTSRRSPMLWPNLPRPPKQYWSLWLSFLHAHIIPRIQTTRLSWDVPSIRYSPIFFIHRCSIHLYSLSEGQLTKFNYQKAPHTKFQAIYLHVPYVCELEFNPNDFFPVDIHHHDKGLSIVSDFPHNEHTIPGMSTTTNIREAFYTMHPSLQSICGNIQFPPDGGDTLICSIQEANNFFWRQRCILQRG